MNPKNHPPRLWHKVCATIAVLVLFVTCFAQKTDPPKEPDLDSGRVLGSHYINDFFGFRLTIPKDWVVNGDAVKKRVMEKGRAIMNTKDEETGRALEDSVNRTSTMLIISKSPVDTAAATPSFICATEKLPAQAGVTKGSDYLAAMKNLMKYSSIKMTVEKDIHPENIGSVEFSALDIHLTGPNGEASQTYYAYVTKGYALTFISTHFDPEGQKTLADVLASVAFQQPR